MGSRRIPLLLGTASVVAIVSALVVTLSAATPSATTRPIDVAATLRKGESRVLYSPSGRVGRIGTFRVGCSLAGRPSTSYTVARMAADTLAAVSGRGASRGGVLIAASPTMRGGSARGGIEHWLLRMAREAEDVTVDVSLAVIRRPEAPGYCEFWLRGSVVVLRR
jgi:hypothetical protein